MLYPKRRGKRNHDLKIPSARRNDSGESGQIALSECAARIEVMTPPRSRRIPVFIADGGNTNTLFF